MAKIDNGLLRVMVDANILIAGIAWKRFPYEVLRHAAKGDFKLVLSQLIVDQAREALARIAPEKIDNLEELLKTCDYEPVSPLSEAEVDKHADLIRDPTDVPIALAAINADVDFLVTQDRDFTDRDESTKALHQQLNIILPGTFLREYMGWMSEELEAIRGRERDDLG